MITGLRILNIALVAFTTFSLINTGLVGRGITFLLNLLGTGPWILVPLITLAATREAASSKLRSAARILNGVATTLAAVSHAVQISLGQRSPFELLGLGMGASAYVFNFWAIGELTRRAPMLPDPVPPNTEGITPPAGAESIEHAASPSSPSVRSPRSTYLRRHWSGDLPLPVSYWVNGSLAALLFGQVDTVVTALTRGPSVRATAWTDLTLSASYVVLTLWSMVGICRSAIKYPAQGGSRRWAGAALIMAGVATLSFSITLWNNVWPQLQEDTAIVTGRDPLGRIELGLTEDGSGLALTGGLVAGSAQDVRRMLGKSPQVRTLLLNSGGGDSGEAEYIAALIRARKLDTYVEANCESACTFLFLAGSNRIATPTADLGFHSPDVAGLDELEQLLATSRVMQFYRKAGLSQRFIEHVQRTAAEDMWYPSHLELMENGVITRVTASGALASAAHQPRSKREYATALRSEPLMAAIERRFPGTLDRTVEAVWQARKRGASHGDIDSTARAALAHILPKLLDLATDEQLGTYLEQRVKLLAAAGAVSNDACALLIASQPGTEEMLAAELLRPQTLWATQVLEGKLEPRRPISPAQARAAIQQARAGVPPRYSKVIDDMAAYTDRPYFQCAATIIFYNRVLALPLDARWAALRGLLQGKAK